MFRRAPLPYDAGWLAARAFVRYRRGGGARSTPLPDFYYIGAHAEVERLTLISRDAGRYQTYFPAIARWSHSPEPTNALAKLIRGRITRPRPAGLTFHDWRGFLAPGVARGGYDVALEGCAARRGAGRAEFVAGRGRVRGGGQTS